MHGRELFQNLRLNSLDLRVILSNIRWGVSREVLREIQHYRVEPFFPTKETYIMPLAPSEIEVFLRRLPSVESLDAADISLLSIALREKGVILSDDGGLTAECDAFQIPSFTLPTFLLNLVANDRLNKRDAHRAYRFWEKERRYSRQELKKVKNELQNL